MKLSEIDYGNSLHVLAKVLLFVSIRLNKVVVTLMGFTVMLMGLLLC